MSNNYIMYKQLRANGYGASTALTFIKKPDLFSLYNAVVLHDGAEFDYKGFKIKVTLEEDADPYCEWLGEFSNTKGKDAIWHNRNNSNLTYQYFNPSNSVSDYQKGFYDAGYSKHNAFLMAKKAIQSDYQAMLDIDQVIVTVTASLEGVELGSYSLHGIDRDYVEDCILDSDMVVEAITDADRTLKKLQAVRRVEERTTRHNKGFSVHYYYSDIPTTEPMVAEATCEALADYADLYYPICVEAIAQMAEQTIAELETELQGRG